MVIQRWQSVFLLLSTVLIALFTFLPFAEITADKELLQLRPADFPAYLVVNILIAALLFLAIFMFKDLKKQRRVTVISMLLIACSAVVGGICLYGPAAPAGAVSLIWCGGVTLLIAALLAALMAYRGIRRDQRTLSSYDRLR